MLVESTVLGGFGAGLGLGLSYWGLRLLRYSLAARIPSHQRSQNEPDMVSPAWKRRR
jgi:hypothetical protein